MEEGLTVSQCLAARMAIAAAMFALTLIAVLAALDLRTGYAQHGGPRLNQNRRRAVPSFEGTA